MKAVIIDDELNSVDVLKRLIEKYCPEVTVIGEAENAEEGRQIIKMLSPDIIFLDIEMPLESGFDMLDKFYEDDLNVIFITAYDHYALKAIKYAALDYLLKPVDIDELILAVNKVAEKIKRKSSSGGIELLKQYLQKEIANNKIALPTAEGLRFVNIQEIIRCEACGNYTKIFLIANQHYLITRTLKEYEEILAPNNFLRIHHAHLININHVEQYVKGKGGYVIMKDGSIVDISIRKKQEFLSRFAGGL